MLRTSSPNHMNTPVLLMFHKRPEHTKQVFLQVRKARPPRIFLASDGPRQHIKGEAALCMRSRELIESMIDWPCEVHRLYREKNLGCRVAVSEGINWFFSNVKEGIILEDDTLPTESFFRFSESMLDRYRHDDRIMHVSGNNYQQFRVRGDGAYYASQFAHSWGWATWARSWQAYNPNLSTFEETWDALADSLGFSKERSNWWRHSLAATRDGKIDTWDFQWHYTIMKLRGICILPQVNLVRNIGVGTGATHFLKPTNTTRTQSAEMALFTAPTVKGINPAWDEFDFYHSVLNKKYTTLTPLQKLQGERFERDHGVKKIPETLLEKVASLFFR